MKQIQGIILLLSVVAAVSCGQRKQADPAAEAHEHIRLMAEANTSAKRTAEKVWAADSLDLTVFADEELRTRFLHAWTELYRSSTGADFPEKITEAAKKMLLKATSEAPGQVNPIVRTLCETLVAAKEIGAAAAIAAYPHGFDIEAGHYSEIAERLLGAALLPGKRAPAIEGAGPMPVPPPSYTILLFYETGCHNCGPIIDELTEAYEILISMNVRVITISSDTDPAIYGKYAAGFPWPDKSCDFQSFAGPDFRRWWVASTPTMWLIDGSGIVVGQFRTLEEAGLLK